MTKQYEVEVVTRHKLVVQTEQKDLSEQELEDLAKSYIKSPRAGYWPKFGVVKVNGYVNPQLLRDCFEQHGINIVDVDQHTRIFSREENLQPVSIAS